MRSRVHKAFLEAMNHFSSTTMTMTMMPTYIGYGEFDAA